MADSGRSVIATLHRPSLRQAGMFEKALILKTGGEMVYFGPVGERCEAIQV